MGASAGFGNRRPPPRKAYGSPDSAEGEAKELDRTGMASDQPPRQMSGILFALAILACIGAGHLATLKGFGRGLDQYWRQTVGYPSVESVFSGSSSSDVSLDRVHNNCKSRSDFVSFEAAKARGPEDLNALHAGDAALNTAATYISCLTAEQPERFCGWQHRTHLLSALKDYYRLIARVRENRIMMIGGPMAAARNSLVGSPGREGSIVPTDQRVAHGLRALIQEGYLSRQDLSPVLHPLTDLELALQGAEPKRKGCA
jgi:hypothetical protein